MKYENYAEIRDSKGMKDFDVCKKSGVGSSTFSDWKHGRSTPKEAKLRKIAEALEIPYSDFVSCNVAPVQQSKNLFSDEDIEILNKLKAADDQTKRMIAYMLAFDNTNEGDDK